MLAIDQWIDFNCIIFTLPGSNTHLPNADGAKHMLYLNDPSDDLEITGELPTSHGEQK